MKKFRVKFELDGLDLYGPFVQDSSKVEAILSDIQLGKQRGLQFICVEEWNSAGRYNLVSKLEEDEFRLKYVQKSQEGGRE